MNRGEYELQLGRTKEYANVSEQLSMVTNLDMQLNVTCEIMIYCMPDGELQINTLVGSNQTAAVTLESPLGDTVKALINKIVDEKVVALSEQIKAI